MYCSPTGSGVTSQMLSYEIRNFKVYFANQHIPDARWSDFIDLGQGYGKDNSHVFFMGHIMENVNPFSFHVMDNSYAKNHRYVFQHGRIVANRQPHSFQTPINPDETCNISTQPIASMHLMPVSSVSSNTLTYEIRDFKVFFNNGHVTDARWIDFMDLGQGYGKDSHYVFFMGKLVPNAHSFSFEVLNKGYAKDKNNVFQNGRIVEGLISTTFNNL
ncbi:hypothetical protein I4U23_002214 [Adineta vaga]|nr:hypothetical protein I4U23_002214 [Adineta vaga]